MNTVATVTPLLSKAPLLVRDGSGFREARAHEIITQAETLILQRYRTGEPVLDLPGRTAAFLRIHVGSRDHRVFGILHLDARARLIEAEDLFRGTLETLSVQPREILKSVLAHQASSVIFYQNYPCDDGGIRPDILLAYRLKFMLSLIEVRVRDHLLIGPKIFSIAGNYHL